VWKGWRGGVLDGGGVEMARMIGKEGAKRVKEFGRRAKWTERNWSSEGRREELRRKAMKRRRKDKGRRGSERGVF